jgi:hypothetical protein
LFEEQFVEKIRRGDKFSTCRLPRRLELNSGDLLDLRRWSGKAYRSPQERIALVHCTLVHSVTISAFGVQNDEDEWLDEGEFAKNEGFFGVNDMMHYFLGHRPSVARWTGIRYLWVPLKNGHSTFSEVVGRGVKK